MKVLVVYWVYEVPMRQSVHDHLYAFRDHADADVYHLNMFTHRRVPAYLLRIEFDLIVFHTTFLIARWTRDLFDDLCHRVAPLKTASGIKVALPQDEYLHSRLLCEFYLDFGIRDVFTVSPPSEVDTLYPGLREVGVRFHTVLTGYLSDATVARIERLAARESETRPIDIGYRAWSGAPWLGRFGRLKQEIAPAFEAACRSAGLRTDISTRREATYFGDDWYRFLLRCKGTIGVEGGASLHDPDGVVQARTQAYLRDHPDGPFEEVEAACFPGLDGAIYYKAISPRHLEACATRTCQILVEGDYNGILRAWTHYIPVKADLTDVEQALEAFADEAVRTRIVEAAYRDIVASGRFTYARLVEEVLRGAAQSKQVRASGLSRNRIREAIEAPVLGTLGLARRVLLRFVGEAGLRNMYRRLSGRGRR